MSLWGALTGSDARRWAQDARDSNRNDLNAGYGAMKGYYGQGYDQARGYLQPYYDQGRKGLDAYQNMLGLNGGDAQRGAQGAYQQFNPYLAAEQGRMQQSLDRRAAATGQFGSGLNALAKSRAIDESGYRNYSDYMNRLQGMGNMGMQAGGAMSGLAMQNAGNLAGVEQWYRGGNMQNNTQYANAQGQANNSMMQNLLGLGGLGLNGLKLWNTWGNGNTMSVSGDHGYRP